MTQTKPQKPTKPIKPNRSDYFSNTEKKKGINRKGREKPVRFFNKNGIKFSEHELWDTFGDFNETTEVETVTFDKVLAKLDVSLEDFEPNKLKFRKDCNTDDITWVYTSEAVIKPNDNYDVQMKVYEDYIKRMDQYDADKIAHQNVMSQYQSDMSKYHVAVKQFEKDNRTDIAVERAKKLLDEHGFSVTSKEG